MDRYNSNIQDERGNGIEGVDVTVYKHGTTDVANLFSDNNGTTKANPFKSESDGEIWFYAANGRYDIQLTGLAEEFRPDIIMFDPVAEGINVLFESGTSAPPSAGAIRFNNADLSLATECYVSQENQAGSDILSLLLSWYSASRSRKDVLIVKDPNFLTLASFFITSATQVGSTHVTLGLSNHTGETSFTADERVGLWTLLAGVDGSITGPGSSTDNAIPRFNGTGGAVLQDSGVTIDDDDAVHGPGTGQFGGALITSMNLPPSNNCNSITDFGVHITDVYTSNAPDTNEWIISTFGETGFIRQVAFRTDDRDDVRTRIYTGSWGSWGRWLYPQATDAQVWAAVADKLFTTDLIESAVVEETLTDAATISFDWDSLINGVVTLTANRTLGNPTNGQPGTMRRIRVKGNSGVSRTLSFDTQYQTNNIGTLDDITSTKEYGLAIECKTTSKFIVVSAYDISD